MKVKRKQIGSIGLYCQGEKEVMKHDLYQSKTRFIAICQRCSHSKPVAAYRLGL